VTKAGGLDLTLVASKLLELDPAGKMVAGKDDSKRLANARVAVQGACFSSAIKAKNKVDKVARLVKSPLDAKPRAASTKVLPLSYTFQDWQKDHDADKFHAEANSDKGYLPPFAEMLQQVFPDAGIQGADAASAESPAKRMRGGGAPAGNAGGSGEGAAAGGEEPPAKKARGGEAPAGGDDASTEGADAGVEEPPTKKVRRKGGAKGGPPPAGNAGGGAVDDASGDGPKFPFHVTQPVGTSNFDRDAIGLENVKKELAVRHDTHVFAIN
jgi:hypothetical protein